MIKQIAILSILCLQPVAAQTVSNVVLDAAGAVTSSGTSTLVGTSLDPSSLRLFFDASAPYAYLRLRATPVAAGTCEDGVSGVTQAVNFGPTGGVQYGEPASISGLLPGTQYTICPEISNDRILWRGGVALTVTMPAASGPATPTLPTPVATTFPAQNPDKTYLVRTDCSDLQSAIDSASWGETIYIPVGTVCDSPSGYRLPNAPDAIPFNPGNVVPSTGTINIANHFTNGEEVHLSTGEAGANCLPGAEINISGLNCDGAGSPLIKGADLYVVNAAPNSFQLATTPAGRPVTFGYLSATTVPGGSFVQIISPGYALRYENSGSNVPNNPVFSSLAVPIQFTTTGTLPGGISAATDYYPLNQCPTSHSQVCQFRISASRGGPPVTITSTGTGTMTIVGHGTGTMYVMPWPPNPNNWIVIRSAAPDTSLPPPGTRIDPTWQPVMATMKQPTAAGDGERWTLNMGILTHNWRIGPGIEITTATNNDYLKTIDPRPYQALIQTFSDNGNIIMDRVYFHGPGYPNRLRVGSSLNGWQVGFINSYLSKLDYWHPWYLGFAASFTPGEAILSSGTAYIGGAIPTLAPTTTRNTVMTVTGGSASGNGIIYFDMTGNLKAILPTGITATCVTAGVTCAVSNALAPAVPRSPKYDQAEGVQLANITFANGSIVNFSSVSGQHVSITSNWNTEGCLGILAGTGPGPYIFQNNYISGTGIPIHFEDSGGAWNYRHDYNIIRNTFFVPLSQMAGSSTSDGLEYGNRQSLEWKGGSRILVKGNRFINGFLGVSPTGGFLAVTPRNGGWTTDVTFTSNSFSHGPFGMSKTHCTDQSIPSRPCQRVLISNNLYNDIDAYKYVSQGNGYFNGGYGWSVLSGFPGSDIQMIHNTFETPPAGIQPINEFSIGQSRTFETEWDNIEWIEIRSYHLLVVDQLALKNCPEAHNAAWIDCFFPKKSWKNNLYLPGWAKPDRTPSGQVNAASFCSDYGGTLRGSACRGSDVVQLIDPTVGVPEVQDHVGINPRTGGLYPTSPYKHAGHDGKDPGIDPDKLQQDQGLVTFVSATGITASSITLNLIVPDAGASCTIGYGVGTAPYIWSRTGSDATNSRERTITINGLAPHTTYNWQPWCADAPTPATLQFSTP